MSLRNEKIKLITKIVKGSTTSDQETEVYAEKKAVNYREFYAAQQVGLNPRLVFSVDLLDYEAAVVEREPTEIIFNGRRYVIIRVYESASSIELTVSNAV